MLNDRLLDKALDSAGSNGKYQIINLIILSTSSILLSLLLSSIGFLEAPSRYICSSDSESKNLIPCNMDLICSKNKTNDFFFKKDQSYTHTSIIIDFNLECSKFQVGLLMCVISIGALIACLTNNLISNYFGRRKTLIFFSVTYSVTLFLITFSGSIVLIYIFLLIISFSNLNIMITSSMYIIEIVGKNSRGIFFSILEGSFYIGFLVTTIFFNLIDNWKYPFIIFSLLMILTAIFITLFLHESPCYLILNSKYQELFSVYESIAKFNDRLDFYHDWKNNYFQGKEESKTPCMDHTPDEDSEDSFTQIRKRRQTQKEIETPNIVENESDNSFEEKYKAPENNEEKDITKIIKSSLLIAFITFILVLFVNGYYRCFLLIEIKKLEGIYPIAYISGICDILASFVLAGLMMNHHLLGRKYSLMIILIANPLTFAVYAFFEQSSTLAYVFYVISRLLNVASLTIANAYVCETFPTNLRSIASGSLKIFSMTGYIIASFLVEVHILASLILTVIISAFITWGLYFMDETNMQPIRNSIPQENKKED